jgi:hypothetical protein
MRIRTRADNKQLGDTEIQIEDIEGAISVLPAGSAGRVVGALPGVRVCTVRGIPSRKAQYATLSQEGVAKLISELERVRDMVWPV